MPYCYKADIDRAYGEALLLKLADRDNSGVVDDQTVEESCDQASSEIDSYLSSRYNTPLLAPTPRVRQVAIDIAVFRAAHDEDVMSDEIRNRYKDAISWLTLVAKGTVGVGNRALDTPPDQTPETSVPAAMFTTRSRG